MIHLIGNVPRQIYVAVSGGPDSMCAMDFLSQNHDVSVLHFDHGTDHAHQARAFVEQACGRRNIPLSLGEIQRDKNSGESQEEFWRNERNRFFQEHSDAPVVTGHHLDDAVEWWLFSCLHGTPRLIPHHNSSTGVIRPFLGTPKKKLTDWCDRKGVEYLVDPSNESREFMRNRVRHDILPHALSVNPGLRKVVRKRILGASLADGRAQ